MRKGSFNTIFEKHLMVETLAREFYGILGYVAPKLPVDYMEMGQHPQEFACYRLAEVAVNNLMS